MRKIIIIVLCFAIAGLAAFGVYYVWQQKTVILVEDVVPGDPLVHVVLKNLGDDARKLSNHPLWKSIELLNYDRLLKEKIITLEQKKQVEGFKANLSRMTVNQNF